MNMMMKNGLLSIQLNGNNKMEVVFKPVNDTVWMDKNELCELYGCYLKDINNALDAIFKKKMFSVEDTCRFHIIARREGVCYDITDVNLTVIIALAFVMLTPQAETLRSWFIEQIIKNKNVDLAITHIGQNFSLN